MRTSNEAVLGLISGKHSREPIRDLPKRRTSCLNHVMTAPGT
jgi:hypothetical protein